MNIAVNGGKKVTPMMGMDSAYPGTDAISALALLEENTVQTIKEIAIPNGTASQAMFNV
jgi:hypothetical protein